MNELKKELHSKCLQLIEAKITLGRNSLAELDQALQLESKSSMGDKYETTRELIQQERNKATAQLQQAMVMQNALNHLNPEAKQSTVELGSLVLTNQGNFYFSVSLGQLNIEEKKEPYFALSLASPLGQAIKGAKSGEEIAFQQQQFLINAIY